MTNLSERIIKDLKALSSPKLAAHHQVFFKTEKGGYGEGDLFFGLTAPQMKAVVKTYIKDASLEDVKALLYHPYHEARTCGVLILVGRYEKAKTEEDRQQIFDFYVKHLKRANNWDLIDISAYKIIGAHLYGKKDKSLLKKLSLSKNLWEQRASVVSTMYLVKKGELEETFKLAEFFLTHPHDLMHKAAGWLLREAGKQDEKALCRFLDRFAGRMPRTMLRYSLEKMTPEKKAHYMKK